MIDLGDVFSLGFEVRDQDDELATPSSSSCTLTLPDGTTDTATLSTVSVGLLRLDYPTVQAGRHEYEVATVAPDSRHTGTFDVDAAATGIVSLQDVRARLNFLSTASDDEVRFYIDSATDYIEGILGPVVRRSVERTVTPAANGTIFLDGPAISLTSMTDTLGYGWTYDVANYLLDPSGVVRPLAGVRGSCYPVTIAYLAGYTVVPALIREAALDYVKWAWESQRGPSGSPFQGGESEFPDLTAATPPYKIAQKLQRYVMPSIA